MAVALECETLVLVHVQVPVAGEDDQLVAGRVREPRGVFCRLGGLFVAVEVGEGEAPITAGDDRCGKTCRPRARSTRNVAVSDGDGRSMPDDELDLVDVEAVVLRDRADGFTGLDPVQDWAHRGRRRAEHRATEAPVGSTRRTFSRVIPGDAIHVLEPP